MISYSIHVVELSHEGSRYAMFTAIDQDKEILAVAKVDPWAFGPSVKPFVSGVHVHQNFRRVGIARGLMDFIATRALALQNQTLALYVHRDNVAAYKLYEQLGFTAYVNDGDDILMAVRIDEMTEVA